MSKLLTAIIRKTRNGNITHLVGHGYLYKKDFKADLKGNGYVVLAIYDTLQINNIINSTSAERTEFGYAQDYIYQTMVEELTFDDTLTAGLNVEECTTDFQDEDLTDEEITEIREMSIPAAPTKEENINAILELIGMDANYDHEYWDAELELDDTCNHCSGTGDQPYDGHNYKPCTHCNGTGIIENEDDYLESQQIMDDISLNDKWIEIGNMNHYYIYTPEGLHNFYNHTFNPVKKYEELYASITWPVFLELKEMHENNLLFFSVEEQNHMPMKDDDICMKVSIRKRWPMGEN